MGEDVEKRPRLIDNRTSAVVAALLTGWVSALAVRSAFFASARHSHWFFPLFFSLPRWAFLFIQFAFIGVLVGLWIGLFRSALGKERVYAAAWFPVIFLTPLENFVSKGVTQIFEGIQALAMLTALLVCLDILRNQLSNGPAK